MFCKMCSSFADDFPTQAAKLAASGFPVPDVEVLFVVERMWDIASTEGFVVEGSALPPDMSFEGVGSVDYVGLHYYLDADGALTELYTEVSGATPSAEGGEPVVLSADAWYSDLGATEVPPMPEGY